MRKCLIRFGAVVLALINILIQLPVLEENVVAAANPGAGEFVIRLYNHALGRSPDDEGFADWVTRLQYGQANGAQIASGILFSEECLNRNMDDASYINALYHIFFNRDADPTGFDVWANALAQGTSRQEVMMNFVNSVEWANICALGGFYSGSSSDPDVDIPVSAESRAFIVNMYRNFASSMPSSSEIDALATDLVYLRTTCRQIASDVIFSDDFIEVARSSSPGKVTEIFFRAFRGRDPLPVELNTMVTAMNGKINLDYLYDYFVNRSIFADSCVNRGLMPGTEVTVNTAGISDDALRAYFADAAFIGNSVTAGFPMYFSAVGRGLLGDVQVYARTSYSFLTDQMSRAGYMLQYDDAEVQAAQLLSLANVRKVFICMGTNDLVGTDASVVRDRYVSYIEGIIAANPGIRVFIVSTPPRVASAQTPGLTNEGIDELNTLMSEYCYENDLDFIDINTSLKNGSDSLDPSYSSDGYVHMNNTGYRVWANCVTSYVRTMLASERHIYRYRGN